jgi:hypothetical protein
VNGPGVRHLLVPIERAGESDDAPVGHRPARAFSAFCKTELGLHLSTLALFEGVIQCQERPRNRSERLFHLAVFRQFLASRTASFGGQSSSKSAQLNFAVSIQTGFFLVDIFEDNGPNERGELRCCQHAIDDGCRET